MMLFHEFDQACLVSQKLVPLATSMLRKAYAMVRSLLTYYNKVRKYLDPDFIDFDRNILTQADHDIWVTNSVGNDTIIQFRAFQHYSLLARGREELVYTRSEIDGALKWSYGEVTKCKKLLLESEIGPTDALALYHMMRLHKATECFEEWDQRLSPLRSHIISMIDSGEAYAPALKDIAGNLIPPNQSKIGDTYSEDIINAPDLLMEPVSSSIGIQKLVCTNIVQIPSMESHPLKDLPYFEDIQSMNADLALQLTHIHDVIGDGNCGPRAISQLLYQDEALWPRVRNEMLRELETQSGYYEQVLYPDDLERFRLVFSHNSGACSSAKWYGFQMFQAAADTFCRPFVIIGSVKGSGTQRFMPNKALNWQPSGPNEPIFIAHVDDNHYIALKVKESTKLLLNSNFSTFRYIKRNVIIEEIQRI
jgi:hypothetical protein